VSVWGCGGGWVGVRLCGGVCSQYFPLDYILMVALLAYFFFATVSGIVKIGIRFLWINVRMRHPYAQT
jgi:ABC-type uncharacterized transport system fused permease/ATPase subunit